MGLSDYKPGWKLLDYPSDIAAMLSECKIDKFSVTGWSVGANLALTVARSPELAARCENLLALAPSRGNDYADPGVRFIHCCFSFNVDFIFRFQLASVQCSLVFPS